MSRLLYRLEGTRFRYRSDTPLLEGVGLDVQEGAFIALIGPNGAGKSTLLQLMTGWLRPDSGSVEYLGRPVHAWSRRDFARQVAVVPQREDTPFSFSVMEMVLMGRHAHQTGLFDSESEEDRAIALNALERVCLKGFEDRSCLHLSGGERQRLLVARALAQQAPVFLLDEPTASLDLGHQRMLFSLLSELHREDGRTVIAVSHDINLAGLYADEIVLLNKGRIAERGTPAEIIRRELLEDVYHLTLSVVLGQDGTPMVQVRR